MFRQWQQHHLEPDINWAAFNNFHPNDRVNFTSFQPNNRVNINNFNRGPHPGPPIWNNPEPRFFDFAHLFNPANHAFHPVGGGLAGGGGGGIPLRYDGRLRNGVTVILPDGTQVMVDRDMMHEYLPRTRNAQQGPVFLLPEFLRGYNPGFAAAADFNPDAFRDAFTAAATFVFRHIEALCRARANPYGNMMGGPDMFERPRFLLANARNNPATVREIYWHVFVLCCVLDQDRALGCSEMFARPIGEFLLEFMPRVEAFMPPGAAQLLFIGYARIFRETRFGMDVLRDMWEMMNVFDQTVLRNTIGPQLADQGMGSNAHRMWNALRQLGVV
ncbi:hypothetical protein C8035_v006595 [Colletotrichum spinosum]|uniref:Uncharacterized protein n=1 Tax=Colletotrichum spinosum TaxID=1347390 RepID=A0A4R8QNH6_9PEZI|nr:hypothetical protein C8035_v006595 [Colletotrichum spinosum]